MHRSEVKNTLTEGDGQMLTILVSHGGHGVIPIVGPPIFPNHTEAKTTRYSTIHVL